MTLENNLINIGNLQWMNKNLSVKEFENGENIREVFSIEEILYCQENKISCYCYHNFDASYTDLGLLYNWHAVTDPRGLAPVGFKVASFLDAENLYNTLKMHNKKVYEYNTLEANILFHAESFQPQACGYFCTEDGEYSTFDDLNKSAWYWTSSKFTQGEDHYAPVFHFCASDWEQDLQDAELINISLNNLTGEPIGSMLSVRCVKNVQIDELNNTKSVAEQFDELLLKLKI